jgi:nitronate monooxygenase
VLLNTKFNNTTEQFVKDTKVKKPLVCGPMYPGSNPELIAAVLEAGGLGVVQPVSLTYL